MVTVEYLKPEQVNGMMWNAHLYIVDGITYGGDVDATTGGIMYVIHKFLLEMRASLIRAEESTSIA